MLHIEPARIMVAVAAHDDMAATLSFAAAEARRRGVGVHLVHVLHPVLVAPDGIPVTVGHLAVRRDGRQALADLAGSLEHALGGHLPVSTEVTHGHVPTCLADTGEHACVIVLQHRRTGHRRLPTHSMTSAVTARCHVPVVAVPPGWREDPGQDTGVTVCVEDAEGAPEVLRAALQEARGRGGRLRVLRVRGDGDPDDPLPEEYDDVGTDVAALQDSPAEALVSASARSSLLIIGRHRSAPRLVHRRQLEPIVREVLREAACPVMVIDLTGEQPRPKGGHRTPWRPWAGGQRPS